MSAVQSIPMHLRPVLLLPALLALAACGSPSTATSASSPAQIVQAATHQLDSTSQHFTVAGDVTLDTSELRHVAGFDLSQLQPFTITGDGEAESASRAQVVLHAEGHSVTVVSYDGSAWVSADGAHFAQIASALPQIADGGRRRPHPGQVADPLQVGEKPGVGEVGLVRGLFHPPHVARMGQIDRPAEPADQLIGQVGRPGAGLDGREHLVPMLGDEFGQGGCVVGVRRIGQHPPLWVKNAHLDPGVVVVEADENAYRSHACCSSRARFFPQSVVPGCEQQAFIPIFDRAPAEPVSLPVSYAPAPPNGTGAATGAPPAPK